jgi:transposase
LSLKDVTVLIDRFISKATRSRLPPFITLAATLRRHRDGILAAVRLDINQDRIQALNNKV